MNSHKKELVGVASNFFVVIHNDYIEVYDEQCKRISYMDVHNKIVKGAAGSTFTVLYNDYIEIYDKDCKRISYKCA